MAPDKETFLFASTAIPRINSIISALILRVLVERFAFWISITRIGQIKGMIYFLLLLMVLPWKPIKY
jgi:membrane protein CcdC involved in cytochrome C biogenesis